jgi:hypothetical protein
MKSVTNSILMAACALFIAFLPVVNISAQGTTAASAPPETASPQPGEFDFNADAKLRDPFWPVGYLQPEVAKQQAKSVASEEQTKTALGKLRYGGTIRAGDRFFATVNGAMVQEGDLVAVTVNGEIFKFRVLSITMKGVKFKPEK